MPTDEEVAKVTQDIMNLSHHAMCRLVRFAPSGHIYFDMTLPYHKIFSERYKELGGMTTQISKDIGW